MVKSSRIGAKRRFVKFVTSGIGFLPPLIGVPVPPEIVPAPWQELESLHICAVSMYMYTVITDYSTRHAWSFLAWFNV